MCISLFIYIYTLKKKNKKNIKQIKHIYIYVFGKSIYTSYIDVIDKKYICRWLARTGPPVSAFLGSQMAGMGMMGMGYKAMIVRLDV